MFHKFRRQATGIEFRHFAGVACGTLMGGIEDLGMEVIDRPESGFRDIRERVAFHQIRSTNHAEQGGSRAEMDHAGKWGEVGLTERIGRADQRDGFRTGQRSGELHASQFVHGFDVSSSKGNHGMGAR